MVPTMARMANADPIRGPGHRALRRGRCSLSRWIYHVTTVTLHREPVFSSFECAQAASIAITAPDSLGDASLLTWVLMPDHMHLLLQLGDRDPLALVVNRIKARSATAANLENDRRGPLWSRGYHEHALRREEDLRQIARYIVANPVRAGLVKRVGDYPFWDAIWLAG